eukprot:1936373-Rhodomonas_salina.1
MAGYSPLACSKGPDSLKSVIRAIRRKWVRRNQYHTCATIVSKCVKLCSVLSVRARFPLVPPFTRGPSGAPPAVPSPPPATTPAALATVTLVKAPPACGAQTPGSSASCRSPPGEGRPWPSRGHAPVAPQSPSSALAAATDSLTARPGTDGGSSPAPGKGRTPADGCEDDKGWPAPPTRSHAPSAVEGA